MYSAKNGRLQNYFNFPDQELTCFSLNEQHRKLYVGDADGYITVYNAISLIQIDKIRMQSNTNSNIVCGF